MTTKTAHGALSTALSSNVSERHPAHTWPLALYLIALGSIGVALHATVRVPLHLPGHHGLEWMGLLAFARMTVPRRWSATAAGVAATAVAFLPVWGFHDGMAPLVYLVSAVALDALCVLIPSRFPPRLVVSLAAALAFSAAGVLTFFAGPHGAAQSGPGLGLWLWSHFGFGLAGAFIGAQLGTITMRRLRANH